MPARDARVLQTTVVPVVQLVQLHAWLTESHAESSSEVVGDSPSQPNCSPDIVTDPSPVRPMFQRSAKLTIGAARHHTSIRSGSLHTAAGIAQQRYRRS
jgi:hypothetical protein